MHIHVYIHTQTQHTHTNTHTHTHTHQRSASSRANGAASIYTAGIFADVELTAAQVVINRATICERTKPNWNAFRMADRPCEYRGGGGRSPPVGWSRRRRER